MTNAFLQTIRSIAAIPPEEEAKLCNITVTQNIKKGGSFIREGDVPHKFAFISRGLFRYYYVNEKGSEFTKGFFPEHNFITSYTAMVKGKPSFYSIEALEDSTLLVVDYQQWQNLYQGHSCWLNFLFSLLEKGYMKKESRERELLISSAQERYGTFLREYPNLYKRLKQHLIASYLGITPVALSRIRKEMSFPGNEDQNISIR
ncbi:MAG TPA: Crp/Fnr family transcriptional regulator [Chryseolinea sp.]